MPSPNPIIPITITIIIRIVTLWWHNFTYHFYTINISNLQERKGIWLTFFGTRRKLKKVVFFKLSEAIIIEIVVRQAWHLLIVIIMHVLLLPVQVVTAVLEEKVVAVEVELMVGNLCSIDIHLVKRNLDQVSTVSFLCFMSLHVLMYALMRIDHLFLAPFASFEGSFDDESGSSAAAAAAAALADAGKKT